MVQRYVAALDPAREPLGVERTVAARTNRLALSGRIDRLDDRGGELVVVDYKTGRRPLTVDDTRGSMALALYAIAAGATLRRRCVRVELHHLPSGEVHAFEHTDASLQRQLGRAEQIADEAAAATTVFAAQTAQGLQGTLQSKAKQPQGRWTCSRHGQARSVAGATCGRTARRVPRRPQPSCPGQA